MGDGDKGQGLGTGIGDWDGGLGLGTGIGELPLVPGDDSIFSQTHHHPPPVFWDTMYKPQSSTQVPERHI